jgi:hypothetical protein
MMMKKKIIKMIKMIKRKQMNKVKINKLMNYNSMMKW